MYNRDFGGIKSEGQLYNMEQEYRYSQSPQNYQSQEPQEEAKEVIPLPEKHNRKGKSALSFLKNLNADDLILIGIGLLLLLDSEEENDMLVLIIALLLFF